MYKVYGNNKSKGWEIIETTSSITKAKKTAENLEARQYYSYIIKESDEKGERLVKCEQLYKDMER